MAASLEDQPKRPDERRCGAAIRPAAAVTEEVGRRFRPTQSSSQARAKGPLWRPGAWPLS
jgi:hypothetical protein